ncbi:MAG: GNAT family N-acetyltransferase [Alphaproteobacteria bacterium]|nr:GNAT family N-acetyltransferase [Alphaproteobacteria bacterium]
MTETETTVTYLEMLAEPVLHVAAPAIPKLLLMRAEQPSVDFYRYLYTSVGRGYHWTDRDKITDEALAAIIEDEAVEVWVVYVAGQPAGYFEIDGRGGEEVELEYFGLMPRFHGRGIGKWLLAEAIRACWVRRPDRVVVETCTLDSPAALALYQKMGFQPFARATRLVETGE